MVGGGWPCLDLQNVVATQALVVHVMVRFVRITSVLVLDEGKAVEKC